MMYLVTTMDGEQFSVPEAVGKAILRAESPFIKFNDKMLNLKHIARVQPDSSPTNDLPLLPPKKYTKPERIKALEGLIKGLKKYMAENAYTKKSEDLLSRMESRLAAAQKLPEDSITENPINGLLI